MCPIRSKSKIFDTLLEFVVVSRKKSGHMATSVYTDGGTKFKPALIKSYIEGVDETITTPQTPESSSMTERTNTVITSHARTCL